MVKTGCKIFLMIVMLLVSSSFTPDISGAPGARSTSGSCSKMAAEHFCYYYPNLNCHWNRELNICEEGRGRGDSDGHRPGDGRRDGQGDGRGGRDGHHPGDGRRDGHRDGRDGRGDWDRHPDGGCNDDHSTDPETERYKELCYRTYFQQDCELNNLCNWSHNRCGAGRNYENRRYCGSLDSHYQCDVHNCEWYDESCHDLRPNNNRDGNCNFDQDECMRRRGCYWFKPYERCEIIR